jgi:hypothetical protein
MDGNGPSRGCKRSVVDDDAAMVGFPPTMLNCEWRTIEVLAAVVTPKANGVWYACRTWLTTRTRRLGHDGRESLWRIHAVLLNGVGVPGD